MINFRPAQLSATIVLLLSLTYAGRGQTSHEAAIYGHVLYQDGSPVAGAEVEWRSFNAVGGILPPPVYTNEKGAYWIDDPVAGPGVLSASKVSEGFPNASLRIYGKFGETGYSSLKTLEITPGLILHDQDLRFGAPDGILALRVIDEKSSAPLKAQVALGLPGDPSPMLTNTISEGAVFEFVIPKHAITVRVSAPGYVDWSYRDKATGRNALSTPPGARVNIVAALNHSNEP